MSKAAITPDEAIYAKLSTFNKGTPCVIFNHTALHNYTTGIIEETALVTSTLIRVRVNHVIYAIAPEYLFINKVTGKIVSTPESTTPDGLFPVSSLLKDDIVYIYNDPLTKDGTTGTVSITTSVSSNLVAVDVGNLRKYLSPSHLFTKIAPPKPVVIKNLPPWAKKATHYNKASVMYVFGHSTIPDGTSGSVVIYTAPASRTVSLSILDTIQIVQSEYLYQKDPLYVEPAPLFTEYEKASARMQYMAELLYAENMDKAITLALKDVDLSLYNMYASKTGAKWAAIIPKNLEGNAPVLMAHCDIQANVKHPTPTNLSFDPKLQKFNSPTGLGADDRAGLFVINQALKENPGKFMAIFFDEEEVGCRGSRNFVGSVEFKTLVDPIASCYISIDRTRAVNGGKTVATYGHDNKELLALFKSKVSRPDVHGSSTDCKILSAESEVISTTSEAVSCVNFSCGYQYEHTSRETLYWEELLVCAVDVAGLPTTIPELWTKQFRAPKPTVKTYGYQNKRSNKHYPSVHDEDFIIMGNEIFTSDDLESLLLFYKLHTGKEYSAKVKTPYIPKRKDFVRLSANVSIGGVYGGKRLDRATHIMLSSNTWVVHSVDNTTLTASLTTDDGAYDAVNIPFLLLEPILHSDILIAQDILEAK